MQSTALTGCKDLLDRPERHFVGTLTEHTAEGKPPASVGVVAIEPSYHVKLAEHFPIDIVKPATDLAERTTAPSQDLIIADGLDTARKRAALRFHDSAKNGLEKGCGYLGFDRSIGDRGRMIPIEWRVLEHDILVCLSVVQADRR